VKILLRATWRRVHGMAQHHAFTSLEVGMERMMDGGSGGYSSDPVDSGADMGGGEVEPRPRPARKASRKKSGAGGGKRSGKKASRTRGRAKSRGKARSATRSRAKKSSKKARRR